MCKAPKPPAPKDPEKPEYLRNPYLDAAIGQAGSVDQIRAGRSSLRIDLAAPGAASSPSPVPVSPPTPTLPGIGGRRRGGGSGGPRRNRGHQLSLR